MKSLLEKFMQVPEGLDPSRTLLVRSLYCMCVLLALDGVLMCIGVLFTPLGGLRFHVLAFVFGLVTIIGAFMIRLGLYQSIGWYVAMSNFIDRH